MSLTSNGNSWTSHERNMNKLWKDVNKSLTSNEQVMNMSQTSCEQVKDKLWTTVEKSSWIRLEQIVKSS